MTCPSQNLRTVFAALFLAALVNAPAAQSISIAEVAAWHRSPTNFTGVSTADDRVRLTSDSWAALLSPDAPEHCAFAATLTIEEPAKSARFAGEGWTVWTDFGYSDGGYDAALKVSFSNVTLGSASAPPAVAATVHVPDFKLREWRRRPWVFDGAEPIMLVATPHAGDPCHQNVKLRPGLKPLVMWNASWDIANQGAFKEGANRISEVAATGGGDSLTLAWSARHVADAYELRSKMKIGWNAAQRVYVYDVDSELEMQPGKQFTFRYGFDFEHHTALDPFAWESLLLKSADGKMFRRPLTPYDSGPIENLATQEGFRAWVGRRGEPFVVGPVVEYEISSGTSTGRKLNTAVCAWAYDTGVSFPTETLKGGDKIEVRYRYTGLPAAELVAMRDKAAPPPLQRTDPKRHFIFCDTFPKVDFAQFASLADPWPYGRVPFLSGHNALPHYALATNTGFHGGYAMRLGPRGHALASLPVKQPLAPGRYIVSAWAKADNLLGPGAKMELLLTKDNTGHGYARMNAANVLKSETHFVGTGTFDWKRVGFVSAIAGSAKNLAIEFDNSGTGEVLFTDFEILPLAERAQLPLGILSAPNSEPAPLPPKPTGILADYRMLEGKGLFVFDNANGPFGLLELANLDWVVDDGHHALRFADNTTGRGEFASDGALENGYFNPAGYADKHTLPVAIAGLHGGGFELRGLTMSAFIKPAAEMGKAQHGGKGDILGVGARRFILGLHGFKAPYRLAARLNAEDKDIFEASDKLEADRW
ncbi:MAG: hypothetical protein HY300_01190 [Verrucomicrobia bacterium]|nr:hypothetical protein [Verrucomicrobiota bacterium]